MTKIMNLLQKRIHIIEWLPKYTKSDVIADFIAGFTVGLTMMPQSIAYASLAGLDAQFGLYTAFIGSFTYVFFGTIKEVSIGPTSLMALLTFSYTEGLPIEFVILLSFLAGVVELLMGVLKLGFLVDFISPPITSGFTSATSIIIVMNQVKNVLGLKIKSHGLIELTTKLVTSLGSIKIGDTVLGICCILFLYGFKKLTLIPAKTYALKKTFWFLSISKNAIVVLITSLIAFFLHEYYGGAPFVLSGNVPQGLPSFTPPRFNVKMGNETLGFREMVGNLGTGVFVVPVIAVLANVAIAKSFAVDKVVDASQEMISLGLCNIFGSFVSAMPSCGAFTRSAVASSSGVRTPLQGIYSGTIIILALSFLTPYFYYIPKSALSAVLIFAVSSLIDYQILPKLWKTNKYDFFITVFTFIVGVLYDVEHAIIFATALNALVLLKMWSRPRITTEIRDIGKGKEYIYIKPELGLYYPAADYLSEFVTKAHVNDPSLPIAIDCLNVLRVDYAALQVFKNMINTYTKLHIPIVLINVNSEIYELFKVTLSASSLSRCQSTGEICDKTFLENILMIENETEEPLLMTVEMENEIKNRSRERKMSMYDNV